MISKDFINTIEDECAISFARLGISMRRGIGHIAGSDDFSGWIGLNVGKHLDFIRINPFIGLHCASVMKICAVANGRKYRQNDIATYAISIGELCPDVQEFIFRTDAEITSEVSRLTAVVEEFGLPFIESISNFQTLLPLLKDRVANLGGYPQRYAAALYLSGKKNEALIFIENEMRKFEEEGENDLSIILAKLRALLLSIDKDG